jgi:hypothetical protein
MRAMTYGRGKITMRCLLVRVGADKTAGGGCWNAPMHLQTNEFVYAAIPETRAVYSGLEKPYTALVPTLTKFDVVLPDNLSAKSMHLDPDFFHLTYGDRGERAKQIKEKLGWNDKIFFYSSLKDVHSSKLIYALIGVLTIDKIVLAREIPEHSRDINAHSRRILTGEESDIVVRGQPALSGRLHRCIPIGEFRNGAYRVRRDLLDTWGGLSVNDGYIQRSARLPEFKDPDRFWQWFSACTPKLIQINN